jgi:DNA-directed RNA polymerase specialized sigma24 family protein
MAHDRQDGFRDISHVRVILDGFSEADWRRVLKLARRFSAPAHAWSPEDLMSEAVARSLSGERRWRVAMEPIPALLGIMQSIANSWRKARRRNPIDDRVEVALFDAAPVGGDDEASSPRVFAADTITPEQIAMGRELLEAVERSVAGDEPAYLVCLAWAEGARGQAAIQQLGMDPKAYDAARKRLLTALDGVNTDWNQQ